MTATRPRLSRSPPDSGRGGAPGPWGRGGATVTRSVARVVEQFRRGRLEDTEDGVGQGPGRSGVQLDRHPGCRPLGRSEEVDVEGVVGRSVDGMVEGHAGRGEPEPAAWSLAAALEGQDLVEVGAHAGTSDCDRLRLPLPSTGQVPFEETPDGRPALIGGLGPVARPVGGEEGVASALVAVELVVLARSGQDGVQLGHLVGGGELVLDPEQTEHRAAQLRDAVDQWPHGEGGALRRVAHHPRAVAVDGGIQRQAARGQERVAPAGAVADGGHLAVGLGLGAQERQRPADVTHHLLVGEPAAGAHRCGGVVRARPRRLAGVEVGAHSEIPVGREPPGDLPGGLVVAGHVVDHHHPTGALVVERPREVRLDAVAAVALDRDGGRLQVLTHGPSPPDGRAVRRGVEPPARYRGSPWTGQPERPAIRERGALPARWWSSPAAPGGRGAATRWPWRVRGRPWPCSTSPAAPSSTRRSGWRPRPTSTTPPAWWRRPAVERSPSCATCASRSRSRPLSPRWWRTSGVSTMWWPTPGSRASSSNRGRSPNRTGMVCLPST